MLDQENLLDYTVCPGWHITDEAKRLGMTKAEVARRLGVTLPTLHRMVSGVIPISPMLAQRLQYVLGIPADIWNLLERQYRLDLVRLKEVGECEEAWMKGQPVKELMAAGLVKGENVKELYRSLMEFYKTGSVKGWNAIWKKECRDGGEAAFVRCVEILGSEARCCGYDRRKLEAFVKSVTHKADLSLDEYLLNMKKGLAACGVSLAVCKSPMKKVLGVAKWKSAKKAIVGVNPEGCQPHGVAGIIWHEIYHVLQQRRLASFLSCGEKSQGELKADKFAYEMTLTIKADKEVRVCRDLAELRAVAVKYAVPMFIVAGRYGDLTGDRKKFRKLCPVFKWPKGVWHL